MIIKREYEYLGRLIKRDSLSRKAYEKACNYMNDSDTAKRVYEGNLESRVYELDFNSGIKGIQILRRDFDNLDKEKPYDNGLSYGDVTRVDILDKSRREDFGCEEHGEYLKLALIANIDGIEHIVQVVDLRE